MQKIIDKIGESICFIIDHYVIILITALLLSATGLYFTLKLPLQSDLAALLPDDYQSRETQTYPAGYRFPY